MTCVCHENCLMFDCKGEKNMFDKILKTFFVKKQNTNNKKVTVLRETNNSEIIALQRKVDTGVKNVTRACPNILWGIEGLICVNVVLLIL